jgi:hypothetical protein
MKAFAHDMQIDLIASLRLLRCHEQTIARQCSNVSQRKFIRPLTNSGFAEVLDAEDQKTKRPDVLRVPIRGQTECTRLSQNPSRCF